MKRALVASFLALVALPPLVVAGSKSAAKGIRLEVVTDRPDAMYHVDEPVTFKITLLQDAKPIREGQISYALSNDGADRVGQGKLALTARPLSVEGKLSHPGFLRCHVVYVAEDRRKHEATAGAGIDPLQIKPSLPVPDDFDAFWSAKKRQLDKVAMTPVLTPVKSPVKEIECFDVQVPCLGGMPVSGYFARPAGAKPKSLPAVLSVHGAGVRSSNLGTAVKDACRGALALDINAHGIPNGRPKAFYAELKDGKLKDYRYRGRSDRETCYFLGMYLRLIRAMDFLAARPEWDGRTLIVHGSSQGGGQSIVAAGLDPRVTAFVANVPAMCEHTGVVNGWPRLVPRGPDGKPDPKIQQVSRYFDAMNFATRTRAEALVSVGFIDNSCRPTTVYAAYNNLRGKKRIVNEPRMRHEIWPSYKRAEAEMIEAHIQKMKRSTTPAP